MTDTMLRNRIPGTLGTGRSKVPPEYRALMARVLGEAFAELYRPGYITLRPQPAEGAREMVYVHGIDARLAYHWIMDDKHGDAMSVKAICAVLGFRLGPVRDMAHKIWTAREMILEAALDEAKRSCRVWRDSRNRPRSDAEGPVSMAGLPPLPRPYAALRDDIEDCEIVKP